MRIGADGGSAFVRTDLVETQPQQPAADAAPAAAPDAAKAGPSTPPPSPQRQQVEDAAARQQLRNDLRAQNDLIAKAEAKAAATGDPALKAAAANLRGEYDALQKSKLAADVYRFDNIENAQPPVGWTRASSLSDTELAKYGITRADLNPGQQSGGFRAELYIPDKSVFGADAKPVLAFRGSTSDLRDWTTNGKQALGQETDYYNRAMSVATAVNRSTGGQFEITGHSLGGGLASAASAVTGAKTTTFNAAGLNPQTAARFLAPYGRTPADTSKTVTGYQVQGELLTSLQESVQGLTPAGAKAITDGVQGAVDLAHQPMIAAQLQKQGINPQDFDFFKQAVPNDLSHLPLAAGQQHTLAAYGNDGQPRPQTMPFKDVIAGLDEASRTAAPFVRVGVAIGQVNGTTAQLAISGTGAVVGTGLQVTGQVLQGTAEAGAAVDRGLDAAAGAVTNAGGAVDNAMRNAGAQADQAIRAGADSAGESVSHVPWIGGFLKDVTSGAGKIVGGITDGGARLIGGTANLGSRIVGGGLDLSGDAVNGITSVGKPAGQALDNAGGTVKTSTATAGQVAHDALTDLGAVGGLLVGGAAADGRAVVEKLSPADLLDPTRLPADVAKAQGEVVHDLTQVGPAVSEAITRHGGPDLGSDGRLSLRTVEGSLRHQIQGDEQALRRMLGN